MAYIQQQAQAANSTNQAEVMSGAYEVQISETLDGKHHTTIALDSTRNEPAAAIGQHNQQQATTQQNHNEAVGNNSNNHQSSSTSSNEERQDNDGSTSMQGAIKTPNSYKYPLLKRYYEFGPWIGRNRKAICLGCRLQTSSSQPDRLLKHLNRCTALTETDKVSVTDLMNERTANKRKRPSMQLKSRKEGDDDDSLYGDEHNASLADDLTLSGLNASCISIPASGLKRTKREPQDKNSQIDEALTRFVISCRIPLKAIHSKEFIEFVHALNPDYRIPSRETITNVLIPGLFDIL